MINKDKDFFPKTREKFAKMQLDPVPQKAAGSALTIGFEKKLPPRPVAIPPQRTRENA